MQSKAFEFNSKNQILHGMLNFEDKNSPTIIFLPGTSGKALTQRFNYLAEAFTAQNFNFVRFNFAGYEQNHTMEQSSLNEELQNMSDLINYLQQSGFNMQKIGIVAKSFGSIKAFLTDLTFIKCFGFLAPATYFSDLPTVEQIKKIPYAEIEKISDIKLPKEILQQLTTPTIIIHGTEDEVIPLENSEQIYQLIKTDSKEIHHIAGGKHGLADTEEQKQITSQLLVSFFKRT